MSYFDFFDTVHFVLWDLVLPPEDDDVTPTELLDDLLTTSTAVTGTKHQ